jgi:carboxyl-terminal processing protease
MKLRFLILLLFFLPIANAYTQQSDLTHSKEAFLLTQLLKKHHINPRSFDEKLSTDVCKAFFEALDPEGVYFTAIDISNLEKYKNTLLDDLNGKSWKFLSAATELFKSRLIHSQQIYSSILDKPFIYSTSQTIELSFKQDTVTFAKDENALSTRWEKYLKYKCLLRLSTYYDLCPEGKKPTTNELMTKENDIRAKLKIIENRTIHKIIEHPGGYENYVATQLFNSLASCYDAHSAYLSKTEWQNLESDLSKEGYSFGLDLDENENGDIIVTRLVPGGPAWKTNEIHRGDILVQLQWEGKEVTDLTGASLAEVKQLFDLSNTGRLELTIKRDNGQIKTVYLLKEKIREDENIVKGFILNGEKKIGYISLPGFYSEWENTTGKGCANDVAKEIVKLQKENIEGLILDIRYNGGGSLLEGLNLAGIFIDEGPLFMLTAKDGKPFVMKDLNRGTVYDGPLVLMINGQSASASEVLASTLQDYNRALIVGSNSFGKATGQEVMPIDSTLKATSPEAMILKSPYGFASITIRKLYRITGKSAQIKGVQPDIHLVDVFSSLSYNESILPHALPFDTVSRKVVYNKLAPFPLEHLRGFNQKRLDANKNFKDISRLLGKKDSLSKNMKNIPLTFEPIHKKISTFYSWWEELETASKFETKDFKVDNTNYDKEVMKVDHYAEETNVIIRKNIESDLYISETYQILKDLINYKK